VRQADFEQDYAAFAAAAGTEPRLRLASDEQHPCLHDDTATTGFDRHYVYHPAWAARVLAETKPAEHVDISSTLHFCATVSAFVPVRFYDYRPAALELSELSSSAADLMALPFGDGSVESLSCMHTIEHIGLGRYGDEIDPDGDLKALAELQRVVAPGGSLLLVVPVGEPRIMFNAHRVYAYEHLPVALEELELREFALIPEHERDGGLIRHADPRLVERERYACGCYWFVRPEARRAAAVVRDRGPRASVVITAYQYGDVVADAVGSARAQSYGNLDVVVVDDGSTDDTPAVLERLRQEPCDVPLAVLRQENSGHPARARNAGVMLARGELIVCLDADDQLAPGFVEACVDTLARAPHASIVYGPQLDHGSTCAYEAHLPVGENLLVDRNRFGSATLFTRAAWEEAGGYDPTVGYEDWDFWLACVERGRRAVRAAGALWFHRSHDRGVFTTHSGDDARTKAGIVLNHPRLYSVEELDWAARLLAGDASAREQDTEPFAMPRIGSRDLVALEGARRFVALAAAGDPDLPLLLAEWNRRFADAPEVTLAVQGALDADGRPKAGFQAHARSAGILDGGAEILALPEPNHVGSAVLARVAEVVVGERRSHAVLRGVPLAGLDEIQRIRMLAERRLAGGPLPPRRRGTVAPGVACSPSV
jgi:glycosyltransferase involved in cell wall biosynthesis